MVELAVVSKAPNINVPMMDIASVRGLLDRQRGEFAKVLGNNRNFSPEKFVRMAVTAVQGNQKLMLCDGASFIGCLQRCAELGLRPGSDRGMYLVPRRSKTGRMQCTGVISYKALCDMARKSGVVQDIRSVVVRTGDKFKVVEGSDPSIIHEPNILDWDGEVTHVYGIAWLRDSPRSHFEVLSRAEVEKVRARAPARDEGPWVTDWEAMARKTALRRLVKLLPTCEHIDELLTEEESTAREVIERETTELQMADVLRTPPETPTVPQGEEKSQPLVPEIEIRPPEVRRRRGRPPGSKNKPAPTEAPPRWEQEPDDVGLSQRIPEYNGEPMADPEEQQRYMAEIRDIVDASEGKLTLPQRFESASIDDLKTLKGYYTRRLQEIQDATP